jgi:tetratricopeptide (TPR) repeat protein
MQRIRQTAGDLPDGLWVLVNALIPTPRVSLSDTQTGVQGFTAVAKSRQTRLSDSALAADILKGLMLTDTSNLNRYLPACISITPDRTQALDELEGLHISNEVMLFYTAALQSQTGDTDAAIQTLQYIIHKNTGYADAYRMLANIYASGHKLDDAIGVLKTGIYYVPSDFMMYALLGTFYNQENDWFNAIESYKMAVLLNPGYENGYMQMALIYKAQGMGFRAKDILEQGLEALPKSTTIRQMLQEIKD